MRITSKGQVTIPIDVRTRAGLLPGTEVEFAVKGDTVVVRRAAKSGGGRGARLVERMRGRGSVRMTTDDIMALTRGE